MKIMPTINQFKRLFAIIKSSSEWTETQYRGLILTSLHLESGKGLSDRQYEWTCNIMETMTPKQFEEKILALAKKAEQSAQGPAR